MAQQDVQDNEQLLEALRATRRGVVSGETWSDIREKLNVNLRAGSIRRSANYLKKRGELFWAASKKTLGGREYTIYLLRLPKVSPSKPKNGQKGGTSAKRRRNGRT